MKRSVSIIVIISLLAALATPLSATRYYDSGIGRWLVPDKAGQYWSPYVYCGNNPLVYVDENGDFAWFVPILIGAAIGGTTGGVIAHNHGQEWWEGAIPGVFIGAAAGAMLAPAVGASGITTTAGAATKGWGITTSIINSANINMAVGAMSGAENGDLWKFGVVGAASGAFSITGGFGMAKDGILGSKFTGRLAYQGIATAGKSIGNNWARGDDPFSYVSLGVGSVNLTLGKGQRLLQWENNIGNIVAHGIGFSNYLTGGKVGFDKKHLAFKFSDGWMGKVYNWIGTPATGAHAVAGINMATKRLLAHELNHVWQSRGYGDSFMSNYLFQGINSVLCGQDFFLEGNYFERMAYSNAWRY